MWQNRTLLAIAGGVVTASVIVGYTFNGSRAATTPTMAAELFLKDIGTRDLKGAYSATAADFREATTWEEFRRGVENMKLERVASVVWANVRQDETQAEIEGNFTLHGGQSCPVYLDVVAKDGAWYVQYIRTPKAAVLYSH